MRRLLIAFALVLTACAQDNPTIDAPDGEPYASRGMGGEFTVA